MSASEILLESTSSRRAQTYTAEESLQGQISLSIETHESCGGTLADWIREHPHLFLSFCRRLPRIDQDLLLSTYVLGKSQWSIADALGFPEQTEASRKLVKAKQDLVEASQGTYQYRRAHGRTRKPCHQFITLPAELGLFRVDVSAPGFDSVFTGRADWVLDEGQGSCVGVWSLD